MWKLAVWESSTLSPVIYAEDMFDQCTVCLVKVHLAHPHVLFSSHLCGNLSAYLTRPSLISVSTFKFKGTGAAESPHCARFVSSIPILMSGSLDNQWCVWPSPQYSGTLTFLCVHIHEWVQVYLHYGTPWRSEDNLNCRASPPAYVEQRLFVPPTPPCLPGTLACELLGILHPLPVSP